MANELIDEIAHLICNERWGDDGEMHHPGHWDHSTARVIVEALGLTQEHQWTPVDESGARWHPRDEALALAAADLYGPGSPINDDMPAITHIEHETRWTTEWERVDA